MRLRATHTLLPAILLVALAGCGKEQGPTVPTAQRSATAAHAAASGSPSVSASANDSDYDKALRYTRCMTANGATTADPVEGEPLVIANSITAEHPSSQFAARRAAHEKCKQFLPATWPIKVDLGEYARARPFFDCLREHGAAEPEPDANGMEHQPTDETWRSTPQYNAALAACRHLYQDPANDQPENK